jgi:hypothetical protein
MAYVCRKTFMIITQQTLNEAVRNDFLEPGLCNILQYICFIFYRNRKGMLYKSLHMCSYGPSW